jgi:hypothetical protein
LVSSPSCADMTTGPLDALCTEVCVGLVPNGCDCYGCCKIAPEGPGDTGYRFVGSPDCALDNLGVCDRCDPVPLCNNDCGECELCVGMTELPEDCTAEQRCDPGVIPCGQPGDSGCAPGDTCITGCCKTSSIIIIE